MDMEMIVEGILQSLHIQYRKVKFSNSELYFCKNQEGVSFNLEIDAEIIIEIWRFIRTSMPADRPGSKIEYNMKDRTVGLEITEENDLNFFSKQSLTAVTPKEICRCLRNQITEFLRLNDGVQNRYKEVVYA